MTDQYVQVPQDSIGKKIDTDELSIGVNTVQRQRIRVAGAGATDLAEVVNAAPTTQFGLVTRNVPSGVQDARIVSGVNAASVTADGNLNVEADWPADQVTTGTIDAEGETVEISVTKGRSGGGWQFTGTWAGTLQFEFTIDGSTWVPHPAHDGTQSVTSTTSNGIFVIALGAAQKVRVRASAWTSGVVTVKLARSVGATVISRIVGGLPLPAGAATAANQLPDGHSVVVTKTALSPASPAAATVGVASAQVLASNGSRKGAAFVNTSNNTISFGLAAAAVLNSGITLAPGGTWVMDEYTFVTGAINAIASAAGSNLAIQEYS